LPDLSEQVTKVAPVNPAMLQRARDEVLNSRVDWVAEYGDYQSGGWWTASLLNASGDPSEVVIRDCAARSTSLLTRLPRLAALIEELDLDIMWARIARLAPNSFLWEHVDYAELGAHERYRLHIPLLTCESAYLAIGGARVHLSPGHIWRLTPTFPHGVCNFYGPDRIHVIIDCYATDSYNQLVKNAGQAAFPSAQLPPLPPPDLDRFLSAARDLIELGYESSAHLSLLRLFFRYSLTAGGCYDLIAGLYDSLHRDSEAQEWRERKTRMLAA